MKDKEIKKKFIYVLKTVSLREKTEEDLKLEFDIFKLKYPKRDYDSFLKQLENFDSKEYSYHGEINAYFSKKEDAVYAAINNLADINDGGLYNYLILEKQEINRMYASIYVEPEDITIFKYNRDSDSYKEITTNKDKEVLFLEKKYKQI